MLRPLVLLLSLLVAAPALAAESAAVRSPRAVATLVADAAAVAPGGEFRLGLRLRLAEGWHTYWRNAGDAGAPPEVTLAVAAGAAAGEVRWPAPERIAYGPLVNFGFKGEVVLPIPVTVPRDLSPGEVFRVGAEATWLVCAEVCIPEEGRFSLALPVAERAVPSPIAAPLFDAAEALLARAAPWQARAGAGEGRASLTLTGAGIGPATVREAFFFPRDPGVLDNPAPQQLTVREGALTIGLKTVPGAAPVALDGVLALRDGGGQRAAFEISVPVIGPAEAAPAPPSRGRRCSRCWAG